MHAFDDGKARRDTGIPWIIRRYSTPQDEADYTQQSSSEYPIYFFSFFYQLSRFPTRSSRVKGRKGGWLAVLDVNMKLPGCERKGSRGPDAPQSS